MSSRNVSCGVKAAGLTNLQPSSVDCLDIWEPQPAGILWACKRPVQRLLYLSYADLFCSYCSCCNTANCLDSTTKNMSSREHDLAGSEGTFTYDDTNIHQSESLYESRYCPFRTLSGVDCAWTGILSDVGAHVRSDHGGETTDLPVKFTVTLQNISTAEHYHKAVFIWDKLFYLIWILKNATLYFTVFHFGPPSGSSGFTYKLIITGYKRKVSVTDTCRSYLQDKREVLKLEEYFALHDVTVKKYLDQNKGLSCHIFMRGMHSTRNPFHMTGGYEAVASGVSHLRDNSIPHFLLSASSTHSPYSSIKPSSVISFLSSFFFYGFFVVFFLSFLFNRFAIFCTCVWNSLTFQHHV